MRSVHKICVLLLISHHAASQFRTNFWVKRFEPCNKTFPTKFTGGVKRENGNQYLDLDITLFRPLDATIGSLINIESSVDGQHFLHLFTIRENYMCKTASAYLGEFLYDIERVAQIPPGVCPIRAARYRVHHCLMNFRNIALQTFPFGTLRFTIEAIDNKSGRCLFCLFVESENKFN